MTAKKNAPEEPAVASGGDYKVGKTILLLLLILDLVAGGTFLYFEFVRVKGLETDLKRSERGRLKVCQQAKNLGAVANTILRNKLEPIDDPGGLIMQIADRADLKGKVTAEKKITRRWKNTSYEEVTVRINFVLKAGYEFGGLITFLQRIEHKNPKLLIKEMNFGKREMMEHEDRRGELDRWRPTGGALTVRTFRLKT